MPAPFVHRARRGEPCLHAVFVETEAAPGAAQREASALQIPATRLQVAVKELIKPWRPKRFAPGPAA